MTDFRERIEQEAAKLDFQASTLEKVIRLGEVLSIIQEKVPRAAEVLVLRGGTALNLGGISGPPKRLSVDLDFDVVTNAAEKKLGELREALEESVVKHLRAAGYNPGRKKGSHAAGFVRIQYQTYLGPNDTIKLDFSYLNRTPLLPTEELTIWQPDGFPTPKARALSKEENVASKVAALLERQLPRDFFDVLSLGESGLSIHLGGANRKYLLVELARLREPFWERVKRKPLELKQSDVDEQLIPVVRQGPTDGSKLSEDVRKLIAPYLELSPKEKTFIEYVHEGELHPELISADATFNEKLKQHPGLQWKLSNAKEHAQEL